MTSPKPGCSSSSALCVLEAGSISPFMIGTRSRSSTRRGIRCIPCSAFEAENDFRNTGFEMFSIGRTPGAGDKQGQVQVFYDIDHLVKHWANYMKVVSVTPDAYGYQTAVVLEKV